MEDNCTHILVCTHTDTHAHICQIVARREKEQVPKCFHICLSILLLQTQC